MNTAIRKDYALICLVMLVLSIVIAINNYQAFGDQKIIEQIIRFILSSIIFYYTVLNINWAKWLLSILSLLGGVYGIISASSIFTQNTNGGTMILLMGLFYVFSGIYIIKTRKITL